MSVTDGQLVNAAVTNAAFVSRTATFDNEVTGTITLSRPGQEEILDAQAQINLNRTKNYVLNQNGSNRLELTNGIGRHIVSCSSTGGAVNLDAAPVDIDGNTDFSFNFEVIIYGTSDTDYLTLVYSDTTGGCLLNGNFSLLKGYCITLKYDLILDRFIEVCRNV